MIYIKNGFRNHKPLTSKYCLSVLQVKVTIFLFFMGLNILIFSQNVFAQSIEPSAQTLKKIENRFKTFGNYIYRHQIKSVKLTNPDWELGYPVLKLNSGQQLKLSFDDLSAESKTYKYRIVHVNHDWTDRDASFYEYASGFEENEIEDYESSFSSILPFEHYELLIPNDDIQLNASGNYVLQVYEDTPDSLILSRRFVVHENAATIDGDVQRATSRNHGSTSHKIPFSLHLNGLQVNDPYSEIIVKILPNNNWHRAQTGFQPLFVRGDELVYKDKEQNIFDAGNEYRTLNIKDMNFEAVMVESINRINNDYHVKLRPDRNRRYLRYQQHEDLNGKFFIEKSNSMTPELDADYVNVYFTLQVESPILSGQVFVYGGFSGYTFSERNAMSYNPRKKQYELRVKLKQGFHDYKYVVLDSYTNYKPDFSRLEGDHWETQNDYLVYVYFKDLMSGYHRVVGFRTLRTQF